MRIRIGVAVCVASLVACSSNAEDVTTSTAESITTSTVIDRAMQWVNVKLKYCQSANHAADYDTACSSVCSREDNPKWDPYRSDCSGFVSWAWGLPSPGRTTLDFAPFDSSVSHSISGSKLAPGDALNNSDHIVLFDHWIKVGVEAAFLEEPGCSSSEPYAHAFTSNVTINGSSVYISYESASFTAIRFDSIQSDPPDAAPDAAKSVDASKTNEASDEDAHDLVEAAAPPPVGAEANAASQGCNASPHESNSWMSILAVLFFASRSRRQ